MAWPILRKLWNYIPQLTSNEIQQICFAKNLTKVLFAALKDKKALTRVMKENLRLKQLRLNCISNQKNKQEKTPNNSNKLF